MEFYPELLFKKLLVVGLLNALTLLNKNPF